MRWLGFLLIFVVVGCETPQKTDNPKKSESPSVEKQTEKSPKQTASKPKKEVVTEKKPSEKKREDSLPKDPLKRLDILLKLAKKAHENFYRVRLLERRCDESLLEEALERVDAAFRLAKKLITERPEEPFVRDAHQWLGRARFALNEERLREKRLRRVKDETEKLLKEGKKPKPFVKEEPPPKK